MEHLALHNHKALVQIHLRHGDGFALEGLAVDGLGLLSLLGLGLGLLRGLSGPGLGD